MRNDGVFDPGGPSERNLLFELGRQPGMAPVKPAELALSAPVGNGLDNRTGDVRAVQKGLILLERLKGDRTAEPNGIITAATEAGIRGFQRDNGLREDGRINPGGPTVRKLGETLFAQRSQPAPTPMQTKPAPSPMRAKPVPPPSQMGQPGGTAGQWVVPRSKAGGPNNPTTDPWPQSPISRDWRIALHQEESQQRNYTDFNPAGPAWGRYQLTPPGLQDAGMMDANNNWTGKYGVHDAKDFLDNPVAQERALADLMKRNQGYIQSFRMNRRFGKVAKTKNGTITITREGMLSAMHRRGNGGVRQYFRDLDQNGWDTSQRPISNQFEEIEERLLKFQNIPF